MAAPLPPEEIERLIQYQQSTAEVAEAFRRLRNERLNIWKYRIKLGDAIFLRLRSNNVFLEGFVKQLDFKKCLAGIRTPSGLTFVKLTDFVFVQTLCKKTRAVKETKPPRLDPDEDVCTNKSLLWIKVHVGDTVKVQIGGDSFDAVVVEINWRFGFVGLSTGSGITYVPIDTFDAVQKVRCATALCTKA